MTLFGRAIIGSARPLAAVALLSAALAACSTAGGGGSASGGSFKDLFRTGGTDAKTDDLTAAYLSSSVYCPPVQIRGGTEALAVYEKGHDGDPAYVKYQASIGKTARECHNTGTSYTIKIGASGRVVAGPKGGPLSVTLPLRIAVVKQFGPTLYSQLFKIPVTLAPPDFGADFAYVADPVALEIGPTDRDLIIFIGFDDGKVPKKAPQDQPTG
jgi:hypothetical protein